MVILSSGVWAPRELYNPALVLAQYSDAMLMATFQPTQRPSDAAIAAIVHCLKSRIYLNLACMFMCAFAFSALHLATI